MFNTQYASHDRVHPDPGNPVKPVYELRYSRDGVPDLEQVGQEDLYGYIQSHRDSVDVHALVKRFQNGDTSALTRAQGFYGDITGMPTTYAEMLNSLARSEAIFNHLSAEVKSRFNNSFSEWLAGMDRDDFADRMGFASAPSDPVAPDVSASVSIPTLAPDSLSSTSGGSAPPVVEGP